MFVNTNNIFSIIWLLAARIDKSPGKLADIALSQVSIGAAFSYLCDKAFAIKVVHPSDTQAIILLEGWLYNFDLPTPWIISLFCFVLGPLYPSHYILEDIDKRRITLIELMNYYAHNTKLHSAHTLAISLLRLRPLYRYRVLESLTKPKAKITKYSRDTAWLKAIASRPIEVRDIRHGCCILGELVQYGGVACFVVNESHVAVTIPVALSAFLCAHELGRARARSVMGELLLEWVELFNTPIAINDLNALS